MVIFIKRQEIFLHGRLKIGQELTDAASKSLRMIQRTLDSLRKKDLIEGIGSDKSGYWAVKCD